MSYEEHIKTCKCNNKIFPLNSRNYLNLLGDAGADGWWDWHIKEDFEYMSPKFWTILGYDPKDKAYHPSEWQKLINQEDLKNAVKNFELHISSRGTHPYIQDVRYTCKDNSIKWIRCIGNVIEWAEDGSPVRMIGTHTDITNIKQLELAMQDQIKMFQDIFDNSIIGMAIISREGKIIEVNNKLISMLKYKGKEIEGRFEVDFLVTQDLDETNKKMAALAAGEINSFHMEKRYIAKDNSIVHTKFNISCKRRQNNIDYFIAEIEDISDKKNSQKKLESTLQELKNFIAKNKS